MYKKTLLSLAVTALLAGCGSDNNSVNNNPGSVSIAGAASVGSTLTASVEDPDGVVETSIIYAWYADGNLIPGATGQTYVVTAAETGKSIKVIVSYVGNNKVRESQTSAALADVPVTVNVAATFIHGLVSGGSCSVFSITNAGVKGTSLATATTTSGAVNFGGVEYDGYGLIECTGGTYVDEASGATLTAPLTRAVVNLSNGGNFVVSPLTEMATRLALADVAGLNSALTTYNALVANKFGLQISGSAINITTVQPTNLQTTAAANDAAGKYATVIALVSQVDENETGSAADVVNDFAADLSDGSLSSTSIQLLVAAEADLATSSVAANLNQAALSAISVSAGMTNTVGAVVIQGSASVGSTLTAAVTDLNGTGAISYQWLANGVAIDVGVESALQVISAYLGDTITVTASYTDNSGFSEQVTSAPTEAVTTVATNTPGSLGAITGVNQVGSDLSVAAPADANGISGSINYQWQADSVDIDNANASSYTLTTAEVGKTLSVAVTYADDDGFDEALSTTAADIVYSAIVANKTALATAVGASVSGDIIGLTAGDYANMDELVIAASDVTVRAVSGATPVISGATCIILGDGATLDGLTFENLSRLGANCDGESSVFMSGNGVTLSNNTFSSMVVGSQYNYVGLKGFQSVIERNSFAGKDVDQNGGYITMYANDTVDSNEGHVIRYNHFRDSVSPSGNASSRNSSAYAVQIGRSTGTDGQYDGLTTVEYNLFSNVMIDRRLVKVQSSRNTVHGNTIVASTGMIAFEDGFGSTASSNIIISSGDDADDGGVSFAQMGHTIVDNYINNIRTTSSQRAALMVNSDPLSGDGNKALLVQALDFTLTVARNTVVNAQRAIVFEDIDCNQASVRTILDFDSNLIANQDSATSINGNTNGSGRTIVTDNDFIGEPCSIDAASDYDNNHFYSATLSESGTFNFKAGQDGNILGAENGATLTTPNANNMVEGSGADAGIGADIDALIYIEPSMVGPNSTWVAP